MSQRTQIFIKAEDLEGNVKNYFLHQQWGCGFHLVKRVIQIFERLSETSANEVFKNPLNFNGILPDHNLIKDLKDYEDIDISEGKVEEDKLEKILKGRDNDNGYAIIYFKSKKYKYDYNNCKIGFYDWDKERKDINFITIEDYLKKYELTDKEIKTTIDYLKLYIDEDRIIDYNILNKK